ncbi:MAG: two-component system response regulator [Halobacteriovorax sp.]|nr:two-component system response regulator [Halobacteriovorax sp.]
MIMINDIDSVKRLGDGPIVIVDDDEMQRDILQSCYERSELTDELVLLSSGTELLEYFKVVLETNKKTPSIVMIDINMPGLNGHELVKKIREHDEFKVIPVIVMLTASNFDKDKQMALENGANGFLTKPSDVNIYISLFNNLKTS